MLPRQTEISVAYSSVRHVGVVVDLIIKKPIYSLKACTGTISCSRNEMHLKIQSV